MWCIPPTQNAEFVAHMEDVLSVYSRPYNKNYPVVCMDEKPYQLLADEYPSIEMSETNHTRKVDCEYLRKGTCSIFMFTEPLGAWREAHALPQRRAKDWANQIKWLIDEIYPNVEKIVLVMDNLNTHKISSLYKFFPPEEAFRLSQKLEVHYTPKHGSWLDIAEIELSALSLQCLDDRRIATVEELDDILRQWSCNRNTMQKGVSWQFTTDDARIKLKHLYPIIEM